MRYAWTTCRFFKPWSVVVSKFKLPFRFLLFPLRVYFPSHLDSLWKIKSCIVLSSISRLAWNMYRKPKPNFPLFFKLPVNSSLPSFRYSIFIFPPLLYYFPSVILNFFSNSLFVVAGFMIISLFADLRILS